MTRASRLPDPSAWPPLTGGAAVWVFMTVEVATFGMFFVAHAGGWQTEPDVYASSQALLHPASAIRGTAILLVGSWLAYQGALAKPTRAWPWMAAAAVSGLLFALDLIWVLLLPVLYLMRP